MAKELLLSGIVQGVFCRKYCSDYAKKLGLHGSASNLHDGTVRVILETDNNDIIEKYIHALKQNPLTIRFYGRIDDVSISDYSGKLYGDYIF